MGHAFEGHSEAEVPASVEEVWEAIATGPGIDSWFMGRNEVENGQVRMAFGEYQPTSAVTAWEPPHHFKHDSGLAPDGRFVAYEFMIEGRDRGATVLRVVTSGFLPGDDWADEFEAMTLGNALFFGTLVTYLRHFAGRTARPITAFGPVPGDWDTAWAKIRAAIGGGDEGDRVTVNGADGVVYFSNPHTLGIRTDHAMYRFMRGFFGPMIASHHVFDGNDTEESWQQWLTQTLEAK
ncbi:SRPBCC domain-containing protein [Lentzea tibetensis]|uniref:SRPBCC domain-containing protein n=1 Tax=Lentzea tibetensis TaxID=2591470 RepID=A0A563F069_9PSEU|nr:SRPBCC domain-containing protein [Lentzea tibetensis]TWP53377.1 SRPBCC domain-containing protein [Lentzea tibetensis]